MEVLANITTVESSLNSSDYSFFFTQRLSPKSLPYFPQLEWISSSPYFSFGSMDSRLSPEQPLCQDGSEFTHTHYFIAKSYHIDLCSNLGSCILIRS